MLVRYIILASLLIISVICDIRSYRVYNLPVALALAAGLIINLITAGLPGFAGSLLAAVLPAALLFVLFALRMLGAGDIKLFCAIGAIMGIKFILFVMVYSFLAGGIIALVVMLVRRNLRQRLGHIYAYFKTCCLTHSFTSYTDFDNKSDGAKFHFTYAIAAGCCIHILLSRIPF